MPSKEFIKGFNHELANRAFALITVGRMTERMHGSEWQVFWKAYWDLEVLNAHRYAVAALGWGLDPTPGVLTRLKAWLVSSVPRPLMVTLVKYVYRKTIAYADWLRALRKSGPPEAKAFLDFMVEQEDFQLEMMRLALAGRHSKIRVCAEEFFLKHGRAADKRGLVSRPASAGN